MRRSVTQRYQEIDSLRAMAIVLMVLFHFAYDLKEFAGVNINYQAPFWFTIGKMSALLFIGLSGLSSGLSRFPVRRGFKVLIYGMGITAVTYLFMQEEYVRFGILHFLGVAMILSPLFMKLSSRSLTILAGLIACLGFWFETLAVKTNLLIPLGLMYEGFSTIDYYPLFPYLAVTILGILAYRRFYALQTISTTRVPIQRVPKWVQWLSRNSLGIYLVHQPVFLLAIFMINRLKF
ncbi:heparan-alpha-glucosaminide N-acetyltransferase [Desulfosporosinus sp. SB140]|uniref:heparan-alpha-glucosaminide N-acetyltransferase n=1 Tax=Desulfosporosinus paludis TaxID=3115649 RepID=UPI00388D2B37